MSPVHVIVGEDPRAEAMWAGAFTGAVDLYRFDRNVDAFERLTAAEASIDLVILTPAQRGPFNLTPTQFIARVLEGPLGSSRFLANLHVIVVGQPVDASHPRVMSVSTLDAAIRLVKFGEVERAPRPSVAAAPVAPRSAAPAHGGHEVDAILADLPFSSSVISSIWDAPRREPASAAISAAAPAHAPALAAAMPVRHDIVGGGSAGAVLAAAPLVASPILVPRQASANQQLFTRVNTAGLVIGSTTSTPQYGAPVVDGEAVAAQVGAPGESIEVGTGALQPARPYQLPNGGGYRGPAVRGTQVHGAAHAMAGGGQPVPPALASQVQSMVYGAQVGNPNDPLLTWSRAAREQQGGMQPVPQQQMRTVPIEPPAGAYGVSAVHAAPAPIDDPFLQRAEQGGGAVSFG